MGWKKALPIKKDEDLSAFTPIARFKYYSINRSGVVINYFRKKYVIPTISNVGYSMVYLINSSGKRVGVTIHRALALTFIPNPENKPCVNHIDGVKTNNNLSNLEWVTYQENSNHAYINGLFPTPTHRGFFREVKTLHGKEFKTIREAAAHYNISYGELLRGLQMNFIYMGIFRTDKIAKAS